MVYFCADDYGISKEYNRRIEACVEKGALNKVSVLPNGDIDDFVQKLSGKDVLLTLHLNLVEGYPLSAPEDVSLLIDENGCFKHSFIGLFLKSFSPKRKEFEKQIYKEIQSQLHFWIEKTGDRTISVDGHQHAYMIPFVFKTLMQVIRDEKLYKPTDAMAGFFSFNAEVTFSNYKLVTNDELVNAYIPSNPVYNNSWAAD